MNIQEKEALIAEIERFKEEAMKSYVVSCWAESYTNTDPFGYVILENENNKVWWLKTQAYQLWEMWQAAKAQAVPEGFVLIKDDTKTVVAIERMVEQQVEASGMDSRRLERLDGWKIIEAAVKAQEPAND